MYLGFGCLNVCLSLKAIRWILLQPTGIAPVQGWCIIVAFSNSKPHKLSSKQIPFKYCALIYPLPLFCFSLAVFLSVSSLSPWQGTILCLHPFQGINNARPIIEDRLGRHGDTDNDDALNSARSSNPSNEEPILVPPADRMWEDEEDPLPAINELLFKRAELQVIPCLVLLSHLSHCPPSSSASHLCLLLYG